MNKYKNAVENEFNKKKVLVIGDLMVDEYISGKVRRISPEAPVPVLDYSGEEMVAGGASNVAHNLASLGANVCIMGVAAHDVAGTWLRNYFKDFNIDCSGVYEESHRPTTVKTRYIAKGHQLLRVDKEYVYDITEETKKFFLIKIMQIIGELDAVIMSDYQKGVLLDSNFVKQIVEICDKNNVVISVDSKSRDISAFENVTFVKPNNQELEAAVNIKVIDEATLNQAGEEYLKRSRAKSLIVTRGSKGISLFQPEESRKDFSAKDVLVFDVSGAGDTVISTITLGIISGLMFNEAIKLANIAAGIVISKNGTAVPTVEELMESIDEE